MQNKEIMATCKNRIRRHYIFIHRQILRRYQPVVSHKLKDGDNDAIDYAARQIAKLLSHDAVLVLIPGHHGRAIQTLQLTKVISSSYTHLTFVDVLLCRERESQYEAKKRSHKLSAEYMGFYKQKKTCQQIESHIP